MIKKDIIYIGEQPKKEIKVWGLPFTFEKNVPQTLDEPIANAILERGKIFSEIIASFKLRRLIISRNGNNTAIRILAIRSLGGLGDVLMNTPVFRAIKESIKNVHLTYACLDFFIPLIQNNPYLDEYMIYDRDKINSENYDVIVDLTRCCAKYESSTSPYVDLHRTDIYLKEIGLTTTDKRSYYKAEENERQEAKEFLQGKKAIGFQLHSNAAVRDWQIDNYKILAKMITDKWEDMHIILFDVANHHCWIGERIIWYTHKPIRQVAALMEQCKAFVSVDSGLMHLAGAMGMKQVALFGNIDAQCRTKYYPETSVIQLKGKVKCVSCWVNECPTKICMKEITPEMVMERLEMVLSGM